MPAGMIKTINFKELQGRKLMKLGPLHQTVILIDTEYLNSRIADNLEFYSKLYPEREFQEINLADLLYQFVINARIEESGQMVDVLFAYRPSQSELTFCEPSNVFSFIDIHKITAVTDKGTLSVRSFFADENETCIQHFINMLEMVYNDKNVSRIVMIADNEELNPLLEIIYEQAEKSLFMIKDSQLSQIDIPIKYVKIDYPIAFSLGLNLSEL